MKYESVIRDRLSFIACLRLGFVRPLGGVLFSARRLQTARLHVRRDRTGHFGSRK